MRLIEAQFPQLHRNRLLSRAIAYSKSAEPELALAAAVCKMDSIQTLLDVGANEGLYPAIARNCSDVHVVAFEPLPELVVRLRNAYPDIDVRQVALSASDAPSRMTLTIPEFAGQPTLTMASLVRHGEWNSVPTRDLHVAVSSLDAQHALGPNLKFLKIDVEGNEMQALNGARHTITEGVGVALVEAEERHAARAPQNVIDWFRNQQFDGWIVSGNELVDATKFMVEEYQPREVASYIENGGDALALPGTYANNFSSCQTRTHRRLEGPPRIRRFLRRVSFHWPQRGIQPGSAALGAVFDRQFTVRAR